MSDVAGRMRILVVDDHPRAVYGFTVMFSTD